MNDPRDKPLAPRPTGKQDWQDRREGPWTPAQRRMLNAVCGCLAAIKWHGFVMSKDDWRHFFAGTVLGFRALPAWDMGDGRRGIIMLGRSSMDLSREAACDAITLAISLGDDPSSQGLPARPVEWSRAVLLGMGYREEDLDGS